MKALSKAPKEVIYQICKFAWERYGHDDKWVEQMFYLSPLGVAQRYFREFVNWEDYRITKKI